MTILYVNGCSYTAQRFLSNEQRYPYLIADHLGWQLIDQSNPNSCNDRIIRCTIRDCIDLISGPDEIMVLLQLSHPARTEVPSTHSPETEWKRRNDAQFESIKPGEEGLPPGVQNYLKAHCTLYSYQTLMHKLMCNLVALTGFFHQHKISYYIFAGSQDLNKFTPEEFYGYLKKDSSVLDLCNFNMLSLTGMQCHPDAKGMRAIADYFIKKIKER